MNKLCNAARLSRAVSNLSSGMGARMPFIVVEGVTHTKNWKVVSQVASAIGYNLVIVEVPHDPMVSLEDVGRMATKDLAYVSGPILIMIDADGFEGSDKHRAIVNGAAKMAAESWSINGETHLLVVADAKSREPLARLIGETLDRTDWAASIAL